MALQFFCFRLKIIENQIKKSVFNCQHPYELRVAVYKLSGNSIFCYGNVIFQKQTWSSPWIWRSSSSYNGLSTSFGMSLRNCSPSTPPYCNKKAQNRYFCKKKIVVNLFEQHATSWQFNTFFCQKPVLLLKYSS